MQSSTIPPREYRIERRPPVAGIAIGHAIEIAPVNETRMVRANAAWTRTTGIQDVVNHAIIIHAGVTVLAPETIGTNTGMLRYDLAIQLAGQHAIIEKIFDEQVPVATTTNGYQPVTLLDVTRHASDDAKQPPEKCNGHTATVPVHVDDTIHATNPGITIAGNDRTTGRRAAQALAIHHVTAIQHPAE